MPELRRLRYFLAVADELNFSRAAERLHIAQPALSRQVRELERELGVELLVRTTHEVTLTEAGAFLRDRGRDLIGAADELWRSTRSFGTGEHGSVIVGFGTSAGYETAPRLLEAVRERVPGVQISTLVLSQEEIMDGLRGGRLDAGLARCPPELPALESTLVRREAQGVLLRSDHRLAENAAVELAELCDEDVLLHHRSANPGHYDAILELYEQAGLTPRVQLRDLAADLTYVQIVDGRAISIAGESVRGALPGVLTWVPLSPSVRFEVRLLARRHNRSPALEQLLEAAVAAAHDFGWREADSTATD